MTVCKILLARNLLRLVTPRSGTFASLTLFPCLLTVYFPAHPSLGIGNKRKAAEEDAVGAYGAEADPIAPEATAAPETADKSAAGAESYDFKEYDLKEYDLGTADGRLYDYGAYDEYGTGPPAPKAGTYDDEVGPGVAAETETEVSESSVSTPHPRPGPPRRGCPRMARIPFLGSPSPHSRPPVARLVSRVWVWTLLRDWLPAD